MSSRNSCHSARVLQLRHLSGKQIFRPRCGSGGFKSFDHCRKINSFLETVNVATKCHGVPSHSGPTRPLGRPWTLARVKAKIKSSPLLLLCFYNNNFQLVSALLLGEKKKSCWEQNVALLTKTINKVCAQLGRCNPAVTPLRKCLYTDARLWSRHLRKDESVHIFCTLHLCWLHCSSVSCQDHMAN